MLTIVVQSGPCCRLSFHPEIVVKELIALNVVVLLLDVDVDVDVNGEC